MKRSKRERRSMENGSDSDSTSGNSKNDEVCSITSTNLSGSSKESAYLRKLKKKKRKSVQRSPQSSSSCSSEELPSEVNLKEEKTTDEDESGEQCSKRFLSVTKNLQKKLPSVKKRGRSLKNQTLPTLIPVSKPSDDGVGVLTNDADRPGNVKKLVNVCDDGDFLSQDSDNKPSGSENLSGSSIIQRAPSPTPCLHSVGGGQLYSSFSDDNGKKNAKESDNLETAMETLEGATVVPKTVGSSNNDRGTNETPSTAEEDTDTTSCEPRTLNETKKTKCKEKVVGKILGKKCIMPCGESGEADASSCTSMEESVSNLQLSKKDEYAVRFVPITFHEDYHGVMLLSSNDIIAVHGCMQMAVVTGDVDFSGYLIKSKGGDNELRFLDVFSSNTSSLLYINDQSSTTSSPEVVKKAVRRLSRIFESSSNDILALFDNVGMFSSCILVKKLYSPMLAVLKKLENFNGFPKKPKFFGPPFDMAVLNTEGWNVVVNEILGEMFLREDGCLCSVMLCGVGNVGKSSLARYVVNRMLAEHDNVFFLDCDCGQTEFTPPSCLSLVKVTAPLLGPPFTHQSSPLASYFYGQISPGETPAEYIKLISNLFHIYHNKHRCEGPLVINTQGWMQGLGLSLLVDCIRLMQPCHIIHISSPTEKRNVPITLSDDLLQHEKGFYYDSMHKFVKQGHGCTYHHLPVTDVQGQHTYLRKYKSRVSRDQCITSYFSSLYQPFLDKHRNKGGAFEEWIPPPLSMLVPYVVRWKDVALHAMHEKVTGDVMLFTFNLSLIGLVHIDPELVKPERDSNSVSLLIDHPVAEYIGFGIVRNIDPTNKLFYILTPVPKESLERVNALVRGSGQLPTSYFLEDSDSNRPYYCADYINVASKMASGMKPRYNLKRKPTKLKTTE